MIAPASAGAVFGGKAVRLPKFENSLRSTCLLRLPGFNL
jgi:hypothetical protein